MTSLSNYNGVRNILFVFVAINAIVLSSLSLFPFIDLPNHLAEAAIYKYHDDPGNVISQYYMPTPWYYPNTFHTVFCAIFPDVEIGNKVFHILCILLLHASLFLIIRELNGNPWYGLLGVLFTYNYNLTFGFVGYAISIPLILIVFYVTLLDIKRDHILLKILVSLLLVVVFLMHAQNALFALLLYGLMMLYHYRKQFLRLVIHGILVPLPLVIFIFTWWFTRPPDKEGSTGGYLLSYYLNDYFSSMLIRARLFFFDNFQLFDGMAGLVVALIFFVFVFIPLVFYAPWKKLPFKRWIFSGNVMYAAIFFGTTLLCYLFLPDKLPGQTPLSQRFCTILMLSVIILGSTWLANVNDKRLGAIVMVLTLCYTVLWTQYLFAFNTENRNFNRSFFSGLDNKAKLTGLIYENKFRGRKVYIHYPNYFLVWNEGIVTSKIIDYRFGVVRRVASENEVPFYHELIGDYYKLIKKYEKMDYILVRGSAPVAKDVNLTNFSLVRETGLWKLYKNKELPTTSGYSTTAIGEQIF